MANATVAGGTVVNFDNFLECEFDSVSVISTSEGSGVLIRILDHEKKRWELTASSVCYFVLNGMCLQNVIERIWICDASNLVETFEVVREKIFFLLQGRYPEAKDELVLKDVIEGILKRIMASQCLMLEITPVYGAYVLLIANRVSLHQE